MVAVEVAVIIAVVARSNDSCRFSDLSSLVLVVVNVEGLGDRGGGEYKELLWGGV